MITRVSSHQVPPGNAGMLHNSGSLTFSTLQPHVVCMSACLCSSGATGDADMLCQPSVPTYSCARALDPAAAEVGRARATRSEPSPWSCRAGVLTALQWVCMCAPCRIVLVELLLSACCCALTSRAVVINVC